MTFQNTKLFFNIVNPPLKTLESLASDFKRLLLLPCIFHGRYLSFQPCLHGDRFDVCLTVISKQPSPYNLAVLHPGLLPPLSLKE